MEPRGETPPGSSGPLLPRRRRQTRAPRSYEVFVAPFAVQHLSLSVFRGGGGVLSCLWSHESRAKTWLHKQNQNRLALSQCNRFPFRSSRKAGLIAPSVPSRPLFIAVPPTKKKNLTKSFYIFIYLFSCFTWRHINWTRETVGGKKSQVFYLNLLWQLPRHTLPRKIQERSACVGEGLWGETHPMENFWLL